MVSSRQRQRICALRAHGLGYSKIAQITGVSKDQVRALCDKYRIEPEHPPVNLACEWCGAPLKHSGRFCSAACRHKAWRDALKHRPENKRVCACCGKVFFISDSKEQKYCSHACYITHRYYTKKHHNSVEVGL